MVPHRAVDFAFFDAPRFDNSPGKIGPREIAPGKEAGRAFCVGQTAVAELVARQKRLQKSAITEIGIPEITVFDVVVFEQQSRKARPDEFTVLHV